MLRKVTRREFVRSAVTGAVVARSSRGSGQFINRGRGRKPQPQPNLVFILSDDLGYGDVSCYGRPDYQTPNIDRLAAQGMRFVNAYSASPVCTPTRCALITGRYPARTHIGLEEPLNERTALGERVKTLGLPAEHPTIASLLKRVGYHTALVGKWHLGYLPNFGPIQSGFDEFFGIMSGAGDFFTHKDMTGHADLFEGEVPVTRIGYMTELLTQRAVEYIRKRRAAKQPFYLSLHYTAPHWPWEGPRDEQVSRTLAAGYDGFTAGGSIKTYAAMIKSMDDGIGKVLATLERGGLTNNTLVVFTSDNGGERFSYNWPFRGLKFSLFEGGIRVPAIARWPGVIPHGVVTEQAAITMDWTATMLAVGNAPFDQRYPLDGDDLFRVLSGSRQSYQRKFFWRTTVQDAVLDGHWKYLKDGAEEYLFDLAVDAREHADFRKQQPAVFDRLRAQFQEWNASVLPRPPARRREIPN
ncbi:MAG TPA: sulfatase-like hydrolase/transferase [Pyrinomonadaceae bacterium]|nr:sulfatase-like hydrolase/transferase [Pyrinomonadaceae bacterium]